MAEDKDKSVLASRVLSFLKRTTGDGLKPTAAETKAAMAAVTLFSKSFPSEATDPQKLFAKLKQVARTVGSQATGNTELSDMDQMRMQMYMAKQNEMYTMLSNIMKAQQQTSKQIIGNLR
jgi:hypothetical protein